MFDINFGNNNRIYDNTPTGSLTVIPSAYDTLYLYYGISCTYLFMYLEITYLQLSEQNIISILIRQELIKIMLL